MKRFLEEITGVPHSDIRKDQAITHVCHLIDPVTCNWDRAVVYNCFSHFEAEHIIRIQLRRSIQEDKLIWKHAQDGIYTVKSGYAMAMERSCPDSSSSTANTHQINWKRLWEGPSIPRSKELVWRACKGILPVRAALARRRIIQDDLCPCCGLDVESTYHALVSCPEVRGVWFAPCLGLRVEDQDIDFGLWFQSTFLDVDDKIASGLACELIWAIWARRNSWVFNNCRQDINHVLSYAASIHCPLVKHPKGNPPAQAWNSTSPNLSYWNGVLQDCKIDASHFEQYTLSYVNRNGNKVAHFLASFAFIVNNFIWLDDFPQSLLDLIQADVAISLG
ncbi:hypothetical protein RIF29_41854 [Crotalaria pallida]|uniref:Reverse transcriptase zinc-binding domain-containing protein n=1 Tax=Crotalaria pallida TaxID=3830 RepID=A0AAN9E6F4_CROPI